MQMRKICAKYTGFSYQLYLLLYPRGVVGSIIKQQKYIKTRVDSNKI